MGFLKFQDERDGGPRGKLHWHRARIDGAPYRGQQVPMLREEEFEEFSERVYDCKWGVFDTSRPDQLCFDRTYQQVLDGIKNNWFECLYRDHRWEGLDEHGNPRMFAYIEWSETAIEVDTKRLLSVQGGMTGGNQAGNGAEGGFL